MSVVDHTASLLFDVCCDETCYYDDEHEQQGVQGGIVAAEVLKEEVAHQHYHPVFQYASDHNVEHSLGELPFINQAYECACERYHRRDAVDKEYPFIVHDQEFYVLIGYVLYSLGNAYVLHHPIQGGETDNLGDHRRRQKLQPESQGGLVDEPYYEEQLRKRREYECIYQEDQEHAQQHPDIAVGPECTVYPIAYEQIQLTPRSLHSTSFHYSGTDRFMKGTVKERISSRTQCGFRRNIRMQSQTQTRRSSPNENLGMTPSRILLTRAHPA
ncbi:hypothetical protein SDC9_147332 [bioreactor metagenome]|uniref:Uncharacterized protein n=1 Tax=bioreactor metagenome TaxID=1076179 RepID=A0A645EDQ9_9ZZZZ